MVADTFTQDPNAVLDWTMDWSKQLKSMNKTRAAVDLGISPDQVTDTQLATWLAANTGTTLTTATVTCPTTGVTIGNQTPTETAVTWRITLTGVTDPTITCTVHVTFSTGEQDEADMLINVRNT